MEDSKEPVDIVNSIERVIRVYESLQNIFSSRDHQIVGRTEEEKSIKKFIQTNIDKNQSGLLYVCGHPGQGKTAVINQVLFDYFGDMDSSLGGVNDSLYVLKYNGMRYEKPMQFASCLSEDLEHLIDFEWRRRSKPIRILKQSKTNAI